MDLSGQTKLVTVWANNAGLMTITFKTSAGATLGNIIVDSLNTKALLDALSQIAPHYFPRQDPSNSQRTHFIGETNTATTEFA